MIGRVEIVAVHHEALISKYGTFAQLRVRRQYGSVKMLVSGLSAPVQGARTAALPPAPDPVEPLLCKSAGVCRA
jgi:hypothetical protein